MPVVFISFRIGEEGYSDLGSAAERRRDLYKVADYWSLGVPWDEATSFMQFTFAGDGSLAYFLHEIAAVVDIEHDEVIVGVLGSEAQFQIGGTPESLAALKEINPAAQAWPMQQNKALREAVRSEIQIRKRQEELLAVQG